MSGTHRDLLIWSRSRCFACKNHRWGLGATETCNSSPKVAALHAQNHRRGLEPIQSIYSCAKHAVRCAQNHRWGLGPIQTCKSGPKVAVLHAQNHRWGLGPLETGNSVANPAVLHAHNDRWCLGPIEICYSGPKLAVLHAKATGEGWNQYRLFILVLSSQLCVLKTADEVWDPYRLVSLV